MAKEFWEADTPESQPEFWSEDTPYVDSGNVQDAPQTKEAKAVNDGAHEAATSPLNSLPEPTEGQKRSGNYRKGHVQLQGLDIAIENPAGSKRQGVDPDGKPWEIELTSHYGYVKRSNGSDGDEVDVFIGPNPASKKVFVIDQVNKDGSYDEHKCMLGFNSLGEARDGYLANYEPGWKGLGAITELPMAAFKAWVFSGKLDEPLGDIASRRDTVASTEGNGIPDGKAMAIASLHQTSFPSEE